MTWEPAFSVGDEELDRQHMRLIGLVNSLQDAKLAGAPRPALDRIASDLSMYSRLHFRNEENLLRFHCYPAIDTHIEEHAVFTTQMDHFMADLRRGQQVIPESLLGFMKSWLGAHLAEADAGYALFLTSRRAA